MLCMPALHMQCNPVRKRAHDVSQMLMRLSCAEPASHWYRKKSSECDAVDLKRSFVFGKKGTVDCITGSLDSSWGWDSYRIIGKQPDFSYFGEHACLLGEKRIATVVSISFCELHSLSRLSLEKMAHQWPELMDEILTLLDEYALRAVVLQTTNQPFLAESAACLTRGRVAPGPCSAAAYVLLCAGRRDTSSRAWHLTMCYCAQRAFSQRLKRARHRLRPRASQAHDVAQRHATGLACTSGSLTAPAQKRTVLFSCLASSRLCAARQACCQHQLRRYQGNMGESARPWTGVALPRCLSVRLSLTWSQGHCPAAAQMVCRAAMIQDELEALQDLAKQCVLQYTAHAALA